ncbi:hypothetical protein V2O64_06800 [Verrucomicrobiaceae bacterium 227]
MNFEKNGGFFSRQRVALIKWYKCAPLKKLLTVREGWIQSGVQMDCWPENSKLRKLFGFLANFKDRGLCPHRDFNAMDLTKMTSNL